MALDAAWCARHGIVHVPAWVDVNGVARARNHAVQLARKIDADYLVMQDADGWIEGPCVASLLKTIAEVKPKPAASFAVYLIRNRPGVNVLPSRPGERYLAERAGTGTCLLDMRALADMPTPWFRSQDSDDGLSHALGEDIYFCDLLKAHGKLLAVDFTLSTAHATQDTLNVRPPHADVERQSTATTAHAGESKDQ